MLRKYLSFFGIGALVCGGMLSLPCSKSEAAVMTPPFATDTFHSAFDVRLYLLPAYIMQPNGETVRVKGSDFPNTSTTVRREINAFNGFFGTDTVNTEFISMHLAGGVVTPGPFLGTPVQFKVGQGTGFRPGLGRSPGQVAENIGTPLNGQLDVFPANSVFDMFLDVWVDVNFDGFVQDGEIIRNFDHSVRMANLTLGGFPPPVGDVYKSIGRGDTTVHVNDPLLGEFGATLITSRINFYVVNPDGTNSNFLAAQLGLLDPLDTDGQQHTHTITPEPTSMVLFGGLMVMPILRRFRRGNRTLSV
jgi:hypothetical protein